MEKAERAYYDEAVELLEVSQMAAIQFADADETDRRDLLGYLIQRATYVKGHVDVNLKRPFDALYRLSPGFDLLGLADPGVQSANLLALIIGSIREAVLAA
jgi:hypothetical protein